MAAVVKNTNKRPTDRVLAAEGVWPPSAVYHRMTVTGRPTASGSVNQI